MPRPAGLPALDPSDDFPRTQEGVALLLEGAGFAGAVCATLAWDHVVDPEVWWQGPAGGIASIGQLIASQPPETVASVRRHFDLLAAEFRTPQGLLALPHTALLASAVRP